MLNRRQLLQRCARSAAGLTGLAASGCGGRSDEIGPRGKPLVLKGWAYEPNEVRANLDHFEATRTTPPVDYAAVSGNYHDKMVAMFVAGIPIDCCYVRDDHFAEWADAGWLQPLPERAARENGPHILPFNLEAMTYRNALYGLPYYSDFSIWTYNARMLEAAGFERCARTLPEITEQAVRLKERRIIDTPLAFGFTQGPVAFNDWWALNYASGIDLFDHTLEPIFPDDPGRKAERILQWIVDGIHRHKIIDLQTSFTTPVIRDNFAAGRQAFISLSKYDLQRLNDPKKSSVAGHARMALYPSIEPGLEGTLGWTRMYCIPRHCRDVGSAWNLIEFLGGRDSATNSYYTARRWYLKFGLGFAYAPLWNDREIVESTSRWGDIDLIRLQGRSARAREIIKAPWFPEFDTFYQGELQRVFTREVSPRDGLGRMAREVRRMKREWA